MSSLLVRVRTKLALHVRHKARSPLPGDSPSVHKGRSMDFDDLREYQRGDDVRDIDWKSTARTGSVLLKRYVAVRKQHVLVVVDTGRSMTALARDGGAKSELAVLVAGVFGSVVVDHGDLVGLVAGDRRGRELAPWRANDRHLEQILRSIAGRLAEAGDLAPSDVAALLRHVRDQHRRRLVLAVITDEAGWSPEVVELVRRLRAQHEIVWFTLLDVDLTADDLADLDLLDVVDGVRLPADLRADPTVRAEYRAAAVAATAARREGLTALGVLAEDVGGEADAIPAVLRVLERSRRGSP